MRNKTTNQEQKNALEIRKLKKICQELSKALLKEVKRNNELAKQTSKAFRFTFKSIDNTFKSIDEVWMAVDKIK